MLIHEQIPKVMKDIGSVAKTRQNEHQKYKFRGIEDLYLAAHPAMVAHGIFCAPQVVERTETRFEKTGDYNKITTWTHAVLKVAHLFYASDGSSVTVVTIGEGLDNSDKASNKAMSAAMKYALIELFCVPTDDVEDADRTTPDAAGVAPTPLVISRAPIAKAPPALLPEDPFKIEEPQYISANQRSYLARRFRESVKAEKQHEADAARHAALTALGLSGIYKSKFVDAHGNPSSEFILAEEYDRIGKALVMAAKSL